jgi:hypothetical protein
METGLPMSNQTRSPVEVPGSNGADARSVEDQLAKLRSDVDHLKTESKSWVKTWGVYLGMLGALIAISKGAVDLVTQLRLSPDTSVDIRNIKIEHLPGEASEIVTIDVYVANKGNFDETLLNSGATLTVEGQSVQPSEEEYGLYDDQRKKVGRSLYVPKTSGKLYEAAITFNPKTRKVAATPGLHTLELRFEGDKNRPYSVKYCFELQSSDIQELFESNEYAHRNEITTECPPR